MNNSNEKFNENSKEETKDEYNAKPEVLLDKENESNKELEIQEDSTGHLKEEPRDQPKGLIDKEHNLNDNMRIQNEIQDDINEIINENPEIENLELINETKMENLESEEVEEENLERQLTDFHKNLIEASLYAAGRPLTIEEISNKLELPKKEVDELINEVAFDYLERSTALVIAQIGDRYQMQIRPEFTEHVSKFAKGGAIAERYLRTLTIIALKQPILKSTVIKLRGTGAYEHVKYLLDNGFIDAVKKGRSQELTTTDKYADMFGLPKNKTELKRAMVTQLGISEEGDQMPSSGENEK